VPRRVPCRVAAARRHRHLPTPRPPFSRSRPTKVDRLPISTLGGGGDGDGRNGA